MTLETLRSAASSKIPPYTVPEADADLLSVGVVVTPERLVEVWSHNVLVRESRAREWQEIGEQWRKEIFHKKQRLRKTLALQGFTRSTIKDMLKNLDK